MRQYHELPVAAESEAAAVLAAAPRATNDYVRIGVRNRTEAIIWATRHGVLDEAAADD